jgi:hypothetical protein
MVLWWLSGGPSWLDNGLGVAQGWFGDGSAVVREWLDDSPEWLDGCSMMV